MKISILAVGKLKERYWVEACAEYLKRLQPYAQVTIREVADVDPQSVGGVAGALRREGEALIGALRDSAYGILLEINGTPYTSTALSGHLDELALKGKSHLAFIVGGSWGVDAAVRKRANETLSFGSITLPHNLVRVVLLEQLYRAQKISRKEPYHK